MCDSTAAPNTTLQDVKDYYGKVLQKSDDLKTSACSAAGRPPARVAACIKNIHEEVLSRYFGCGFVAPELLRGKKVLDLGCGAGYDVYILAQLVGEQGSVVGVDMTEEQLEVARRYEEWHRERFGFTRANTSFLQGYIERLGDIPELVDAAGTFDVIVSNCVINLSIDKPAVFREAHRLLRPGGELYFSDMYADRRIPDVVRKDPVMWGEGLGGSLYLGDFHRVSKASGFPDCRLMSSRPIEIKSPDIAAKVGGVHFEARSQRMFKHPDLEDAPEDYGEAVQYLGSICGSQASWRLDEAHVFEAGRVVPVSGNTATILRASRFAEHFEFFGSRKVHFGPFTEPVPPPAPTAAPLPVSCG
eukprot:TRINITY_DN246_c0_g1_i3.p1 TRINITY_DN246_c0_g1~~TRINITY_DN246_c0_g1_i3.p1  ORF type:complete len:392 (+),score=68.25 TRINITY_DN246_c0_g1_i3:100-1176(+)